MAKTNWTNKRPQDGATADNTIDATAMNELGTEVNAKVTKDTGTNRIYVTDGSGNTTTAPRSSTSLSSGTVVQRGTGGRFSAGDGVATGDVVTKAQLDAMGLAQQSKIMTGTVATASGTAIKTATLDAPYSSYVPVAGDYLLLTFTAGMNVSSATLAVNGGSAFPILSGGGSASAANTTVTAGVPVLTFFDGVNFRYMSATLTALSSISAAEIDTGTSTSQRVVPPQIFGTKLLTQTSVPASAGAAGRQFQFALDASFLYICTATNTWRRVALSSW